MGMDGFQVNPEGMMESGSSVMSVYNDYEAERASVENTTDRIQNAWDGADSEGYITQIHSYDADFKELGVTLEKIGNILISSGNNFANTRDTIREFANRL